MKQEEPIRIRKSEIRAQDRTAPMADQFADTVKRSASYLLKSIGIRRADLRPALNRAYANFFNAFIEWMSKAGRTSQRKLNEPQPSLGLLEAKLHQCNDRLTPLMNEVHAWSHVNPNINFHRETDEMALSTKTREIAPVDPLIEAQEICDRISLREQRTRSRLHVLQTLVNAIECELKQKLEEDFGQQINLTKLIA